jgi:hypothetical protein
VVTTTSSRNTRAMNASGVEVGHVLGAQRMDDLRGLHQVDEQDRHLPQRTSLIVARPRKRCARSLGRCPARYSSRSRARASASSSICAPQREQKETSGSVPVGEHARPARFHDGLIAGRRELHDLEMCRPGGAVNFIW